MTDNFAATVAFRLTLASPVLIWSITRLRSDTTGDRVQLFGEVFVVTVAAIALTRFAVIPFLRWQDVTLLSAERDRPYGGITKGRLRFTADDAERKVAA